MKSPGTCKSDILLPNKGCHIRCNDGLVPVSQPYCRICDKNRNLPLGSWKDVCRILLQIKIYISQKFLFFAIISTVYAHNRHEKRLGVHSLIVYQLQSEMWKA